MGIYVMHLLLLSATVPLAASVKSLMLVLESE